MLEVISGCSAAPAVAALLRCNTAENPSLWNRLCSRLADGQAATLDSYHTI